MRETIVTTPEELQALCDRLRHSRWLALDTEFMREQTYYPQFCLLQLCNGEEAATVDPLVIEELSPLLEILYDPQVMKVFHAARQDLELFFHRYGRIPQPLFDTQLAAGLLGFGDQIGYANLVETVLNIRLEKAHTRTDWSRRPLGRDQLRYALEDVIHLAELYPRLEAMLQELGRREWLQSDLAELAAPATYLPEAPNLWQKVKGWQELRGVQRAVLQGLAVWREETARRSDRPRRWILKDEVMLDFARRLPRGLNDLERIRGLEAGTVRKSGEELLAIVAAARHLPKEEWPQLPDIPPRLSPNQEAQADMLVAGLRLVAERNGIAPAAIGARRDLERLVAGQRDGELLRGWKGVLLRDTLFGLLEGRLVLGIKEGRLEFLPVTE